MTRTPISNVLNQSQVKAVKSSDYPSYLQAGAGSGKTHVLIEKILHILKTKQNVSLENFAIITFTNKATDELASRLQEALYKTWLNGLDTKYSGKLRGQIPLCNMIDISTIHSFCESLLRKHGALIGVPNTFVIKSFRQETRDIVTRHINNSPQKSAFKGISQFKVVDLVLDLLQDNSNKGLVIDENRAKEFEFNTPDNEFFNGFKNAFLQVYTLSEAEILDKKKGNVVSTNDLITLATKLLDNPKAAVRISKQYKYLFVDEFQDTNFEQFKFIEGMIKHGVKVFVIGDKKQSIYAFRGADVENSDRIDVLLKDSKRKNLSINYRTDPKLLAKLNTIFGSDFLVGETVISFPHQSLESALTSDACPEPLRLEFGKSVDVIINEILESVCIDDRPASYEDIAILCRRNADVDSIGRHLKSKGVPVEIIGGKGFYSNTEIVDTYKLLNAVIYSSESTIAESRNTFYHRALMYSNDDIPFDNFLEQLDSVFKTSNVVGILGFIFDKSHSIEYLRHKKQYQAIANLMKLKDKANELTQNEMIKPLQFLEFLDIMITSGKDEDEAEVSDDDRKSGVVSLYSIHKAKGLEFPIVIVPNCDLTLSRKNIMPKIIYEPSLPSLAVHRSILDKDNQLVDKDYKDLFHGRFKLNLEEELRIFYVACSRAKHMLILSCQKSLSVIQQGRGDNVSWIQWVLNSKLYG